MKIVILNGSPKGKYSITLQTLLYLHKRFPTHEFDVLHIGQRIKSYEKDFSKVKEVLENSDLILFAYPVYTFIAPYQVHRFLELMKENSVQISGKYAAQITTSKHFYDMTAHKFIEENCYDFELKYLGGLSADMDDLQKEKGRYEADCFFEKLMFDIEHEIYIQKRVEKPLKDQIVYEAHLSPVPRKKGKDVVVVTNVADEDTNLKNMIKDFENCSVYPVRVINIREYPFSGGCLGCFQCSVSGECIYKDQFDVFLRNEIQSADALIYAFTIENHYTHSSFKCYDDRQFCNGHRAVTHGKVTGYLMSGEYGREYNLQTIVEGRSEVSGMYLCGIATDEENTEKAIQDLANSLTFSLEYKLQKPQNFYGVGGRKIFRDLVYLMQGLMQADHKFYKATGVYDFPQKQKGMLIAMKILGLSMKFPAVQKKMKGKMTEYILMPYTKILEQTKPKVEDEMKTEKTKRSKGKIVLFTCLVALLFSIGAMFVWASDYYPADSVAVTMVQTVDGIEEIGNLTVVSPTEPTDVGFIFYPGAKVEAIAYLPILEKISETFNMKCVLVEMPFNMAIFDVDAADKVIDQFSEIKNWYIGGHSMGGAMASSYASENEEKIQGLILMGAYIYGEYPPQKTLTVYGTFNSNLEKNIDYTENIVELEGGNHAQFGNYGKQKGDPDATITTEEQQRMTVEAMTDFFARISE